MRILTLHLALTYQCLPDQLTNVFVSGCFACSGKFYLLISISGLWILDGDTTCTQMENKVMNRELGNMEELERAGFFRLGVWLCH